MNAISTWVWMGEEYVDEDDKLALQRCDRAYNRAVTGTVGRRTKPVTEVVSTSLDAWPF